MEGVDRLGSGKISKRGGGYDKWGRIRVDSRIDRMGVVNGEGGGGGGGGQADGARGVWWAMR